MRGWLGCRVINAPGFLDVCAHDVYLVTPQFQPHDLKGEVTYHFNRLFNVGIAARDAIVYPLGWTCLVLIILIKVLFGHIIKP